jgi:2',3'-cyclic-nucleotide 2'-phosphodiesterase (5'-nucleotidase family)
MENRRHFIKKCGLLGSLFLVDQNQFAEVFSSYSRFNLNLDLSNVNFFFTGNLKGDLSVLSSIKNINSVKLDAGNFISSSFHFSKEIKHMNNAGYQVVALGKKELKLTEDKLIQLTNLAEFSLVNSHLNFSNPNLEKAIKKFQIININDTKSGIIAISEGFRASRDLEKINHLAYQLKNQQNCNTVICLIANEFQKKTVRSILIKSKNIDLFWTSEIPNQKGGNLILKNIEQQQVMLIYGEKNVNMVGHYQTNLLHPICAFPLRLSHQLPKQFV